MCLLRLRQSIKDHGCSSKLDKSIGSFLLGYFLFFTFQFSFAQSPPVLKFNHIATEHGLSSNFVTSTLQDSDGFLWISTHNGLNRYDGYQFINYTHQTEDPTSISSNQTAYTCSSCRGWPQKFWNERASHEFYNEVQREKQEADRSWAMHFHRSEQEREYAIPKQFQRRLIQFEQWRSRRFGFLQ